MTLEDKTYEPERYRYAAAAAQFIQGKDMISAKKCLDKLLIDMNATDEDIKAGMVWNAYPDNPQKTAEGIAIGIGIYGKKYQDALGEKTIKEMYERYSAEFEKYLDEGGREVAKAAFDALGDRTYESILEEVEQLNEIIESKTKKYSEEDKEKAQRKIDKYADVVSTIQEYEGLRISRLMAPVREETIKDNVNARFKKKEKK
jgi:hypothetical protein